MLVVVPIEIRFPRPDDEAPCIALAREIFDPARAEPFIRSHLREHRLVVADAGSEIVGFLGWRTDWFDCSFVELVVVAEEYRRRGIARECFLAVEALTRSPRIFSSTEETNAAGIRMHAGLGFQPSGHVENLPQGHRELLFYKRLEPRMDPPKGPVIGVAGAGRT